MERHIGTWYKENEPQKQEVAELVIDGNSVEFYSRFYDTSFPVTFIGSDGEYKYKVFANGSSKLSSNRLLKHTVSHRVFYVLMENFEFSRGIDISGIKEFSFSIPELIDWLGIKTVFYGSTDMDEMAAGEAYLEPIIINSHNPYIELYFESKTFNNSIIGDDRTQITIMKEPRIKVKYEQCQDINVIMNDIECLMQFWGLLIGRVTEAKDIRLSVEGQKLNSWLYFNRDFSYNTIVSNIHNKPRTYLYIVKDNIQNYFSNWRSFYYDASYSLIRRIYFSVNNKNSIFAEDIFVQYMRILDGYHSRISGDEETKMKLREALKATRNSIKRLIFNQDGQPLFEDEIKSVIPEWKYNSSRRNDISEWIASGFLAKTSLSCRLQELDNQHLNIISKNAVEIEKAKINTSEIDNKTDDELIQLYFKELGDTRNYYSHYKLDTTGVLELGQILNSINVLKATIISIFFKHMGIEIELIRKILRFDSELWPQTICLNKEGDREFICPSKIGEAEKVSE